MVYGKKSSFNCRPKKILDNQHLLKVHKCYQREAMLRKVLQIFLTIIILFSIYILHSTPQTVGFFFRFPESRLAKMFNGSIPIILDSLKQHYFIDRDGKMFRYILSYLRSSKLLLPENFSEYDQLLEEAKYFDLKGIVNHIEVLRRAKNIKQEKSDSQTGNAPSRGNSEHCDCIAVSISPDLGERISLSAEKALIEELFPELIPALMDSRNSGFNLDNRYVIRFPLNGFCKLNSIQVLQTLFNADFKIVANTGGGVEGQQFSEYLFCRYRKC